MKTKSVEEAPEFDPAIDFRSLVRQKKKLQTAVAEFQDGSYLPWAVACENDLTGEPQEETYKNILVLRTPTLTLAAHVDIVIGYSRLYWTIESGEKFWQSKNDERFDSLDSTDVFIQALPDFLPLHDFETILEIQAIQKLVNCFSNEYILYFRTIMREKKVESDNSEDASAFILSNEWRQLRQRTIALAAGPEAIIPFLSDEELDKLRSYSTRKTKFWKIAFGSAIIALASYGLYHFLGYLIFGVTAIASHMLAVAIIVNLGLEKVLDATILKKDPVEEAIQQEIKAMSKLLKTNPTPTAVVWPHKESVNDNYSS